MRAFSRRRWRMREIEALLGRGRAAALVWFAASGAAHPSSAGGDELARPSLLMITWK